MAGMKFILISLLSLMLTTALVFAENESDSHNNQSCDCADSTSNDVLTWHALIIELIAGAVLGIIFFKRQSDQARNINRIFNNRHKSAYYAMEDSLNGILVEVDLISEIADKFQDNPEVMSNEYRESQNRLESEKDKIINICNTSCDVLLPDDESNLRRVFGFAESFLDAAHNAQHDEYWKLHERLKKLIESILEDLQIRK